MFIQSNANNNLNDSDTKLPKILFYAVHLLQHFKLLIEELHVKGEGKVKKAMKESFKILNEVCSPLQHHL